MIHWRLKDILSTLQHNECSYGFRDSHQQEVHEINDQARLLKEVV